MASITKTAPPKLDPLEATQNQANPGRLNTLLSWLLWLVAGTVLTAFLVDLVGLAVRPWLVGPLVIGLIFGLSFISKHSKTADKAEWLEIGFFVGILAAITAYALWPSRSSWLPAGVSPDTVHQYGIASYIEQTGRLPIHDLSQRANLQEGIEYPPAYALLVALLAQTIGVNVAYVLHLVASLATALAIATTFAIAATALKGQSWYLALASLAAAFVTLTYDYTFASFTLQTYYAQVTANALLLGTLYFLLIWRKYGRKVDLTSFALTSAALLLCYPTLAFLPIAAFGIVTVLDNRFNWRERGYYLLVTIGPLLALTGLFLKDRLQGGIDTVSTEGLTLSPDLARWGWPVVILAAVGLAVFWRRPPTAIIRLLAGLLVFEGLGMWLVKIFLNKGSYYAIHKLFYTGTYFMALLAVIGLAALLTRLQLPRKLPTAAKPTRRLLVSGLVGLMLFGSCLASTWLINPEAPWPEPVFRRDTLEVAQWMQANLALQERSVAYNTMPGLPAYWFQVGVFRFPRDEYSATYLGGASVRFEDWLSDTTPYLLTDDYASLKNDSRAQVLFRSGNAAVLAHTSGPK